MAVGLVESRNAARRVIGEGGASVNGEKVTDLERVIGADDVLHGEVVVLRRGRKNLAAARRTATGTGSLDGRTAAQRPRPDPPGGRRFGERRTASSNVRRRQPEREERTPSGGMHTRPKQAGPAS